MQRRHISFWTIAILELKWTPEYEIHHQLTGTVHCFDTGGLVSRDRNTRDGHGSIDLFSFFHKNRISKLLLQRNPMLLFSNFHIFKSEY